MGAGTLAVTGDLKNMHARWLRGASFAGYGTTLAVGIGLPIPILNEEILRYTAVTDADIVAQVVDYSEAYPNCIPGSLGRGHLCPTEVGFHNDKRQEGANRRAFLLYPGQVRSPRLSRTGLKPVLSS